MNFLNNAVFQSFQNFAGNNPILNNALEKAKNNQFDEVEKIARNLCQQRGINPDAAFRDIQMGLMNKKK